LLNGCARGEAQAFGTRIFETLQSPSGVGPAGSVSVGVAEFPADGTTLDQLLDAADRSMYGAKRQRAA